MNSRFINYFIVFVLILIFIVSLYNIKNIKTADTQTTNNKKESFMEKYGRFAYPTISMISFFIACVMISLIISEGNDTGKDKYSGIIFLVLIGVILTIMNLSVLGKNKLESYIKGKKFSIVGLFMALGVSAIVFGFLDNFGMKLGTEALDDGFLQLFLSPFSTDTRFTKHKKNISKNLKCMNEWVNNDWRKILNQLLRFRNIINNDPRLKDLSNAIKNFNKLDIPNDILKDKSITNDYVDNIRAKYDIIDGSKAMLGNTFSDFIGAILGAALVKLFIYMTSYDGIITGDDNVDDSFFVKHLSNYMPFMEAIFIALGCLVPIFINIAMNRRSNKKNNILSWIVVAFVGIVMVIMMFIGFRGVKDMTLDDKKKSIRKTLKSLKSRIDLDKNKHQDEGELDANIENFINSI